MCMGGSPKTVNVNGKDEVLGTQSPEDAAAIRAMGHARAVNGSVLEHDDVSNAVLGWQSVAPPDQPDLADTQLKKAKQQQLLSGLASTGYMATFLAPPRG